MQRAPATEPVPAGEFDARLFRRLKALRRQISLEEGVPPHAVLHKFSLQEMAVNQPRTLDALAECYGVDAEKVGRYGERFLAALEMAGSGTAASGDIHEQEPEDLVPQPDLSGRHDRRLFARLDALRIEIARAEAVSPLAVFPDRTLLETTVLLPRTLDALAECHGVGPRKLKRCGTRFPDEIRAATDA